MGAVQQVGSEMHVEVSMTDLHQVAPLDAPVGQRTFDSQSFRVELEQQRRFRLDQLTQLVCDATVTSGGPLGDVTSTLMTAARTALAGIDAALFRLAIGSFGVCQQCSGTIPADRLGAILMASLCLQCQYSKESQSPPAGQGAVEPSHTAGTSQVSPPTQSPASAVPDIVDVWGLDSFPASDPPANW